MVTQRGVRIGLLIAKMRRGQTPLFEKNWSQGHILTPTVWAGPR